ncbi:MAG: serine/threonine protein kinase, partial [Myxococcales bacterium]|nr:serine/threonine protein kinase [Myxococcales bacterium]
MEHGQVLAGRWRVDARVDAGGMGVVFRGTDLHDGTAVAIKALLGGDERERARFQREARALAELAHPAVVRYLDHGGTESPWLVMEWLEGETLATRLERTGLTPPEAIAVARRLALGLAAAHRAGIVHRDVKPRNVMLPGGDVAQAKLIDFGIVHVEGASVELTRAGGFIGTPAYVAPELARGHGETDARADLFALGCVLYECLTGRPAFAGGHVWAVLTRVLLEEPPPVSVIAAVPSEVDALVARLLAKDPARRPAGGDAVVAALDALPPFDGVRRVVPTAEEDLLSADELRVVAVVLVSTPASAWSDETLTDLADSAAGVAAPALPWAALEAIASERGARVERLLGGAAALVLEGAGAAHDHAAAAARCALAVHAAAPGTSVALAIGHARARAGSRATPAGEVIDRAAALLG